MGILITQRKDDGWFLNIREEWLVDTKVDAMKIMEWLIDENIEFDVSYSFELVHIKFGDEKINREKYRDFKKVLDKIIEYKNKYGHGVI